MKEDYQKQILEEFVRFGGRAERAMNVMKTINNVFKATRQIKTGPVETILKACLMERKRAIHDNPSLTEGHRAILYRYLYKVFREQLKGYLKKKKKYAKVSQNGREDGAGT